MRMVFVALVILTGLPASAAEWKSLPSLPDAEGVAGPFAGVSHGALVVAGGANFPDKKPWDGGQKVWYDEVFVLEKPDGKWKSAGRLPRPLGYGVSVTHRNSVVCVGGSDAETHHADAFRLEWIAGKLTTTRLPSLPKPLANSCGALVGDVLYIVGGIEKPDSTATSKTVYRMDLASAGPKWSEIEPCPGRGRMLSVAASFDRTFWLVGGVDLVVGMDGKPKRHYLADAYRYDPGHGWKRIADLPNPIAAAPSPAPTDASGFYLLGGDDGTQVAIAPEQHPGFAKTILRYNPIANQWTKAGQVAAPRVTVPCVSWRIWWVIPSGESRPGTRSPAVMAFSLPLKTDDPSPK